MDKIRQQNQAKFLAIRKLNLPVGAYAITASGVLGIRNLRAIGDIDIIVTQPLWEALTAEYGITDSHGVQKIVFPDGIVEAFREGSFHCSPAGENAPNMADRIAKAEIIDGLPFDALENVLYYKRKMGRDKDLKDMLLIKQWLEMQN